MKVLFWGTPDFAIPCLRALLGEGHQVVGVVSQPDRPAGRGRKSTPSPIKEVALAEGVKVLTPDRPQGKEFLDTIRGLDPDISVVVAYGHILTPQVLELPRHGSVNVHASLLPELRGAAPIQWAIARGHSQSGVTTMKMTEGLDEGPILLQREFPIARDETGTGLYLSLSELGAEALIETLVLLEVGALDVQEQDDSRATYAPKVNREVARVDWNRSADELANHIRGMDMVPGAWTMLESESVKVFRPEVLDLETEVEAGTVLAGDPEKGLIVKAGMGSLQIHEVQPSGRRRMDATAWLRGGGARVGARFR